MGLLYKLFGVFPTDCVEFIEGLNRNKLVEISVVSDCERAGFQLQKWYGLEVSQGCMFSNYSGYKVTDDLRRVRVPTDKTRYYPRELCTDVENLIALLNDFGINSTISFIDKGPENDLQMIFNRTITKYE